MCRPWRPIYWDKAFKRAATKGKNSVKNGRALFTYNPDLFKDKDEEGLEKIPEKKGEEQKEEEKIDESLFANEKVEEEAYPSVMSRI